MLFTRLLLASLEPLNVDGRAWRPFLIVRSSDANPGVAVPRVRGVRSRPAQSHVLTFSVKLKPWRPSELIFPLWLSHPAQVDLLVGEDLVVRKVVPASAGYDESPESICASITEFVSSKTNRVTVLLRSDAPSCTLTVALGLSEPDLRPRVEQRLSWARFTRYFTGPVVIWAAVLAVLLAVSTLKLAEIFGTPAIAVVTTSLVWFAAVAGISKLLVDVDLHTVIRSWLESGRWTGRGAILLAAAILIAFAVIDVPILACTHTRWRYSRLITRYAANEAGGRLDDIVTALDLSPWRAEAQLLLQRYVGTLRLAGALPEFRRYVKDLVSRESDRIKAATVEDSCLSTEPQFKGIVSDPAIWFALLLPEAENMTDVRLKTEAQRLLAARNNSTSELARHMLALDVRLNEMESAKEQLGLASQQRDQRKVTAATLRLRTARADLTKGANDVQAVLGQLRDYSRDPMAGHVLQEAWDHIGDARRLLGDRAAAINAFRNVMFERERQRKTVRAVPWLRMPSKLFVFWYFRAIRGRSAGTDDFAVKRLAGDPLFRAAFIERVYRPYDEYKDEAAWYRGTLFETPTWDAEVAKTIRNSLLPFAWKY